MKIIGAVLLSLFLIFVFILVVVLVNKRTYYKRTQSKPLLSRKLGKDSAKEINEQTNSVIDVREESDKNNLNIDKMKLRWCGFIGNNNGTNCQSIPFIGSESPFECNGCEWDSCKSGQNNEELDKESCVSSDVSLTDSGIEVEETHAMINAQNVTDSRKPGNRSQRPKKNSGKNTEYEADLIRNSKYLVLSYCE